MEAIQKAKMAALSGKKEPNRHQSHTVRHLVAPAKMPKKIIEIIKEEN